MNILGVAESAVRRIREEIIVGKLPPGSRLNEMELSERFGISRPPLREAFRMLGNEKLVEFMPRRGTFVAPMSLEDGEQVYRARQMLECTAIDIIGQERTASLAPLRDALAEAQRPPETLSVIEDFHAMSRFHVRLIELAGNRWLIYCHQSLQSCLARYQVMYLNLPGSHVLSVEEHRRVLSFLEDGQYEAAKQHLIAHLNRTRQCLRDSMPSGLLETEGSNERVQKTRSSRQG